jgi:hypothetical protein
VLRREPIGFGQRQRYRVIQSFDFPELLAQLADIDRWLAGAGVIAHNRLRQYQRNIRSRLQAQHEDDAQALDGITESKARETFWSIVEADEFARAVVPLRARLGDESSLMPVTRALDGPTDLYLEAPKSSHGRNFMFELIMGGRLARAGLIPSFVNGPHLEFTFRELRVSVQCKRPFSMDGLEQTIRKAISQLKKDDADLSLIALSISRLWNSGDLDEVPTFPGPRIGQATLDARSRDIADRSRRFWQDKLPRAATFFYGFTPVRWPTEDGSRRYASLRTETVCPVMTGEDATEPLFKSLLSALGG